MASYKYEVVGADGKPKTGTIEAMNMEVASAELKSGGNTIVSIARANAFNKDLEIHIGKAVSVREMSVFCRQFESVLNAGVTVVEALDYSPTWPCICPPGMSSATPCPSSAPSS